MNSLAHSFLYAIRSFVFSTSRISFSLRFFVISIYVVVGGGAAAAIGADAIVGQLKSVFIGTKWVAINFSDCNIFKLLLYCFEMAGWRLDRKILWRIFVIVG